MKKQIKSLIITAAIVSSCALFGQASFTGLTSSIEKHADSWIETALSSLSYEDKLTYLNLFVDPAASSIESAIKCVQTIETNEIFAEATAALQNIMQAIVEKYYHAMDKKFKQQNSNPSEAATEEFFRKLEPKIYELIGYINQLFYKKLYNHLAQENADKLFVMFNENGVIAKNKRTKVLPKPVTA